MPVGVSAFLIEAEIDCYICMCVCLSQVERERESVRVRKCSSVLLVFPHQGFLDREATEQKSFVFSISHPMIRTQRNESLSRSDDTSSPIKTRDKESKRTPPEIGFASKENLFS